MSSDHPRWELRRRVPPEARAEIRIGTWPRALALSAAVLCAAAGQQVAWAQGFEKDPSWPCIQRKVPSISAGMVWAGPPLDEVGNDWRNDPTVAALASKIASRRTSIEEAKTAIEQFAKEAGDERSRKLTMLFAGVLDIINHDRASIIAGIGRYAERQQALAEKIEKQSAQLAALPSDGTEAQQSDRADLEEIQTWDIRIFEEREHSLTYVCEQPVLLEQRAFALGREIMKHID